MKVDREILCDNKTFDLSLCTFIPGLPFTVAVHHITVYDNSFSFLNENHMYSNTQMYC